MLLEWRGYDRSQDEKSRANDAAVGVGDTEQHEEEQVKDRIKDSPMVFRAQIESSRAGQNEYTDEGQTKNNPRKEPGLTGSKEVKLTFVSGVLS